MYTSHIPILLFVCWTNQASPVVDIIVKNQFKPIVLASHGTIATEKYIITTKYPIADHVVSQLCVFPERNLKTTSEEDVKKICIDIKRITFTNGVSICFVELAKEIEFTLGVNPAMIPAINNMRVNVSDIRNDETIILDYKEECIAYCDVLEDTGGFAYIMGSDFEVVNEVKAYGMDGKYLAMYLAQPRLYCSYQNGLPVYCKGAVVGMITHNPNITGIRASDCTKKAEIIVAKLASTKVQNLLKKFLKP